MLTKFARFIAALILATLFSQSGLAQPAPSIQFTNYSGEDATVKLAGGPTSGYVEVPNGTSKTVAVRGGLYWIVTRYCDRRASGCTYSRGESFNVTESAHGVSRISITLHKVANGNYRTDQSSARDF